MQPKIFLAVPHYDAIVPEALPSITLASLKNDFHIRTIGGSLLAFTFNNLWCQALNDRKAKGYTHFAMHHSDIGAEPGWIDTLITEMEAVGADIISAVVPIKDDRGLTSTGLYNPVTETIDRYTLKEVADRPMTFLGPDGSQLMINTGLWVCKFTDSWCENVHFEVKDEIVKTSTGRFVANVLPEDWNFSQWANDQGLRVAATKAVKVGHVGRATFRNDTVWGRWSHDEGDKR